MNIEILRERLAKDPHNTLFRFSLGQALYQQGQWQDAIEHLKFCCESRDDWMLPRIMLGKALMETGERETAVPLLQDGLRLAIDQHHDDPAEEARTLLAELGVNA